jgi:hypothetical protein
MLLSEVEDLLLRIRGGTFASLDAETFPYPGIKKVTTGEQVMLFTNKGGSAYERLVKRRLEQAGKNPANFVLGDLAWGERVPDSPLIHHRGKHYLQVIEINPGVSVYYFTTGKEVPDPEGLGLVRRRSNQGLAPDDEVIVRTYKLDNIIRLTLMGETRPVLRPRY